MDSQKVVIQRLISPDSTYNNLCGDGLPSFLLTNPLNTTPPFATQIGASVSARDRPFYTNSTTGMSALDDSVCVNGTVCNAQPFNQFLSSRDNPNPTILCLTHGQSIGLAVGNRPLSFLLKLISRTADSRSVLPKFIFCDRYKYLYSCESDFRALPLRFCPVLTRCCIAERTMVQEERSRD